MARRYFCDIEGLTENWVDVSEVWTRREYDLVFEAAYQENWMEWFGKKATACHIVAGEVVLTDPAVLNDETLADADLRLWGFLGGVLVRAAWELKNLGNASGRLLSGTNGAVATTKRAG